jgi:hypothetical protein
MSPSPIWKNFTKKENIGVCVICNAEIKLSKSRSTFGFWQHLKGQHYLEYDTLKNGGKNINSKDALGALKEHNNPDLGFQSNVIDDAQQAASVKERMVPVSNKRETYKDWVKWGEYTQTLAEIENNENKGETWATFSGMDIGDIDVEDMPCEEKSKNVEGNRNIKWGNERVTGIISKKIHNKIKCISDFVSKLLVMNHEERESCLKCLSARRIMYISEICGNIINGNVGNSKKKPETIRCHKHVTVIKKLASMKSSLKTKSKVLVTRFGLQVMNTLLPKVEIYLKCVLRALV